jgi:hypothetical protein
VRTTSRAFHWDGSFRSTAAISSGAAARRRRYTVRYVFAHFLEGIGPLLETLSDLPAFRDEERKDAGNFDHNRF